MRKTTTLIICLLLSVIATAQFDKNGNPIFNTIVIDEQDFGEFEITTNYYTIANNIDNKESSVYKADNPTKEQYLEFARTLPSYGFLIHKGQNMLLMVMLMPKVEGTKTSLSYMVLNPSTQKSVDMECGVWGEISEKRADELQELKVDEKSRFVDLPNNGKGFLFNGIAYRIQPYEELKSEVVRLAQHLMAQDEEIEDPNKFIEEETIGGKLDFDKVLEGEKQAFFLFEEVAYNKKDFAILLWGKAVRQIGIKSEKEAAKLWEGIHKRKLTKPEKKALETGFNTKVEK